MHALTILHRCVAPLLVGIHARRLAVLLEAVAATVSGPRLTLTEIGRRLGGGSDLRHRIKRADRLLGNRHLQGDSYAIYGALARMLLNGVAEPLIVIDWSDLKEDQSVHLLRASLPVGGRSLTLYEEVHPQRKLGNRQVQHRFLQRLKALLPATAQPIIVADSGFKVPFYREVERLDWRWVGRVRGRDFIQLKHRWRSCQRVFAEASETPRALGIGELIGTAAERCGVHERMRPGSRKRRAYSRLFLARRLLTLEDCRTTIAELVDAIETPDLWVANDHDRLLAE
jgi:hypothetical protein